MYQIAYEPIAHLYHLDGILVPSVTRITDVLPGKEEWLPGWACKEMGLYLEDCWLPGVPYSDAEIAHVIKDAKRAHKIKKDDAADAGTKAHAWFEEFITGAPLPMPSEPAILNAVQLFLLWYSTNKVKFLHSEVIVGSKRHMYAGRFDAVAEVNGLVTLIDFKTSKAIYPTEHYPQLAGYQLAYEEMGKSPPIQQRMVLWVPKTGKKFKAQVVPTPLGLDTRLFLAAREMYGAFALAKRTVMNLEAAAAQERADGDQSGLRPAA